MLTSFFLLWEIYRALGLTALFSLFVINTITLMSSGFEGVLKPTLTFAAIFAGFALMVLPVWYWIARSCNNTYTVLLAMNEEGIVHIQIRLSKS